MLSTLSGVEGSFRKVSGRNLTVWRPFCRPRDAGVKQVLSILGFLPPPPPTVPSSSPLPATFPSQPGAFVYIPHASHFELLPIHQYPHVARSRTSRTHSRLTTRTIQQDRAHLIMPASCTTCAPCPSPGGRWCQEDAVLRVCGVCSPGRRCFPIEMKFPSRGLPMDVRQSRDVSCHSM